MRSLDMQLGARAIGPGFLVVIVSAWAALNRSSIVWLAHTLGHADFRLNLFLALGAVGLLTHRFIRDHDLQIHLTPGGYILPHALLLSSAVLGWWIERRIDLSLGMATCFGFGTYALLGLVIDRDRWRRGFLPATLLILCLPFGAQADAYVGFLARSLSAEVSRLMLSAAGISAISTETILVLDNGIAHVDVPCSGVRSLWAGAIFFLAATWMEQRRLGWSWAGLGGLMGVALLAANVLRVSILVLVAVVFQQSSIAEIIHVPLGVLGFVGACAMVLILLRRLPGRSEAVSSPWRPASTRLLAITAVVVVGLAITVERRPPRSPLASALVVRLPEDWRSTPVALAEAEQDLFGRFSQARATKLRFRHAGLNGSVLMVLADNWRSHHPPELCLAGSGYVIGSAHPIRSSHGLEARVTELDHGARLAVHWFQSPNRTTDRLLSRIWADVTGQQSKWVLVSVLIDAPIDAHDSRLVDLLDTIRDRVEVSFEENTDEDPCS